MNDSDFKVFLAGADNLTKTIMLHDPDIARTFCEDYLNNNLRDIIKNQISEMKRRSIKGEKPPAYYERFLFERN